MDNTLRKLQLCQLNILKDIDSICSEHNIRYFLFGGTVLGAVRHGGFIPWDDDLDIAMYRSDYKKFLEVMKADLSGKYFLQSPETDNTYPRIIAKVRLNGTIQQERSFEHINCNNGIYIDVFPLDKVKNPNGLLIRLRGAIVRLALAYETVRCGSKNGHNMYLKKLMRLPVKLIPKRFVYSLLKWACERDNDSNCNYVTAFLSGYKWKRQLQSIDTYGSGTLMEFENGLFPVPVNPDAFLTSVYGDYMQLPPVNKRTAHKLTCIDFGVYDSILENELNQE